jgi:hypothetical protein
MCPLLVETFSQITFSDYGLDAPLPGGAGGEARRANAGLAVAAGKGPLFVSRLKGEFFCEFEKLLAMRRIFDPAERFNEAQALIHVFVRVAVGLLEFCAGFVSHRLLSGTGNNANVIRES